MVRGKAKGGQLSSAGGRAAGEPGEPGPWEQMAVPSEGRPSQAMLLLCSRLLCSDCRPSILVMHLGNPSTDLLIQQVGER